mgnify:CR=1 FL=1
MHTHGIESEPIFMPGIHWDCPSFQVKKPFSKFRVSLVGAVAACIWYQHGLFLNQYKVNCQQDYNHRFLYQQKEEENLYSHPKSNLLDYPNCIANYPNFQYLSWLSTSEDCSLPKRSACRPLWSGCLGHLLVLRTRCSMFSSAATFPLEVPTLVSNLISRLGEIMHWSTSAVSR